MAEKKITVNIQNLMGLSLGGIENDIEYLLFVDHEDMFPMSEYTKMQPIIEKLAKLVVIHADDAARAMQRELLFNIGRHLEKEVGNVVYKAERETTEKLTITDTKAEPHNDW